MWVLQITEPCQGYFHVGSLPSREAGSFLPTVCSSLDCRDFLFPVLTGSFSAEVMVIISVVKAHPTCPHERHTFLMVFHGP